MSLTGQAPKSLKPLQKVATLIGMAGLIIILLAGFNVNFPFKGIWLTVALVAIITGIILFSKGAYANKLEGIKNDGVWFKSMSSRGFLAWLAGI
jgi:hypothetical protein